MRPQLSIYTKKDWLAYFEKYAYLGKLYVNCKYRPQLKDHSSLRKLVRLGVFKQGRSGATRTSRKTYLELC